MQICHDINCVYTQCTLRHFGEMRIKMCRRGKNDSYNSGENRTLINRNAMNYATSAPRHSSETRRNCRVERLNLNQDPGHLDSRGRTNISAEETFVSGLLKFIIRGANGEI